MSWSLVKGAVLQLLAFSVLLGGTLFLLFGGYLSGENIFRTIQGIFGVALEIGIFYYIMSKADPESLNNPFT